MSIGIATMGKFDYIQVKERIVEASYPVQQGLPKINIKVDRKESIECNVFIQAYPEKVIMKIDANKEKKIPFSLMVEGTNPSDLEYYLRFYGKEGSFGFKGVLEDGQVSFNIPKLNDLIKSLEEQYTIKMEVLDRDQNYYSEPYSDIVTIQNRIKMEAQIKEEKPSVSVKVEEKEVEHKEPKYTKGIF